MALFTSTSFGYRKGSTKKGKSAETLAYEAYQTGLKTLNEAYLDDYGNPKSEDYFIKKDKLINMFMPQVSEARSLTLQNEVYNNGRERKDWAKENGPVGQLTMEALKKDLNDMWTQVSTRQSVLQSGNFDVMARGMEEAVSGYREAVEKVYAQAKQATSDRSTLRPIEEARNYLEEQEAFYRGVYAKPKNYRVDMSTNEDGEVYKIELKRAGAADTGMGYIGTDTPNGLKIYTDVKQGDTGKYVKLGSYSAQDDGSGMYKPSDDAVLDFKSLALEDKYSMSDDLQLVAPDGKAYIKNPQGGYYSLDKPMEGYRNRPITEDEAKSFSDGGWKVTSFAEDQRKQEIEAIKKKSMDEYLASETGQPYAQAKGKTAVEFAVGHFTREPFKMVSEIAGGTARTSKYIASKLPEPAKDLLRKAGKSVSQATSQSGRGNAIASAAKEIKGVAGRLKKWFSDINTPMQ